MPPYQPEAALAGPPADLEEAWTCAVPSEWHYNRWIADRTCDFLQRAEPPFLLFVFSPDPHHPFSPPRPWAELFDPDTMLLPDVVPGELNRMPEFVQSKLGSNWIDNDAPVVEQGGMTVTTGISEDSLRQVIALTRGLEAMIDDACGRVLKTLDQQGFSDETIILFTSDHGEFLGNHGLLHKGPPPYCDLSRVSFLMAGPGIPEGASTAELSSPLDLMPTLLDLSGIAPQGLEPVMHLTKDRDGFEEIREHQDGKGDEMKPAQYFRGALKVPGQTAKAGRPGKAALHHPTSGQERTIAYPNVLH